MHTADRRHHDDVPGPLPAHDRNHFLGKRDGREEIGFELAANFAHFQVLSESGQGKPCVIDQQVDSPAIADNRFDEAWDQVEVSNVESSDIQVWADSSGTGRPLKLVAPGKIAHAGN